MPYTPYRYLSTITRHQKDSRKKLTSYHKISDATMEKIFLNDVNSSREVDFLVNRRRFSYRHKVYQIASFRI